MLSASAACAFAESLPVEGYAAAVNDRVILVSDVMNQVRRQEQRLRTTDPGSITEEAIDRMYKEALDLLIERALILEDFEAQEGALPDRAADEHIETILREQFNNDQQKLHQALADEEMTIAEWRDDLKDEMIVSALRRQVVFNNVSVSPGEVRRAYEDRVDTFTTPAQVKLRIISVAKGTSREEMLAQAAIIKEARSRITFGEPFETVARELSEGRRADAGGAWDWTPIDDLRTELADVARTLEIGALSRGLVGGDNLYLMVVVDRKAEEHQSFESVRDGIEDELRRAQGEKLHAEWIARLKKSNYVKIY